MFPGLQLVNETAVIMQKQATIHLRETMFMTLSFWTLTFLLRLIEQQRRFQDSE